jgi:hypothetical protein
MFRGEIWPYLTCCYDIETARFVKVFFGERFGISLPLIPLKMIFSP